MGYLSQDDIRSVAHSLSKCIHHLTRACHHWCTLFLYGALHIRPDNDDVATTVPMRLIRRCTVC